MQRRAVGGCRPAGGHWGAGTSLFLATHTCCHPSQRPAALASPGKAPCFPPSLLGLSTPTPWILSVRSFSSLRLLRHQPILLHHPSLPSPSFFPLALFTFLSSHSLILSQPFRYPSLFPGPLHSFGWNRHRRRLSHVSAIPTPPPPPLLRARTRRRRSFTGSSQPRIPASLATALYPFRSGTDITFALSPWACLVSTRIATPDPLIARAPDAIRRTFTGLTHGSGAC